LVNEVLYCATISPRLGEGLVAAVEKAAQLASEFPDMGSPYKYGTRRVFPKKFPFPLVYVVRESEVCVLAFAPSAASLVTGAHAKNDG
jgi:hypothetical protein